MHLKRTATFAAVGAALAAWLAGAATSGTRARPAEPIRPVTVDTAALALEKQVSRLHERLAPAAVPRQPGRDLFRFAELKPKAMPRPEPRPAALAETPVAAALPARPVLKLEGLAEDAQPDGIVRTAIITTGGRLFLAKEGELVTPRFRITRIAADVVELVDLTDNSTLRLPLR